MAITKHEEKPGEHKQNSPFHLLFECRGIRQTMSQRHKGAKKNNCAQSTRGRRGKNAIIFPPRSLSLSVGIHCFFGWKV